MKSETVEIENDGSKTANQHSMNSYEDGDGDGDGAVEKVWDKSGHGHHHTIAMNYNTLTSPPLTTTPWKLEQFVTNLYYPLAKRPLF